MTSKEKWRLIKDETGQNIRKSPTIIKEGQKYFTKPREIAAALNRQYILSIRDTISKIPRTNTNPLNHYKKAIGPVDSKLEIQEINMAKFKQILMKMKSTTSTTCDFISIRIIKEAGDTILPQLLHMINSVIKSGSYPKQLKVTKIVPIPKEKKDPTTQAGWRPVNIVPALSKLIEKCLLEQVMNYLKSNNFIDHSHHGSISNKNTQTLVQEMYEILLESLETGDDSVFIQLDQSKAYDVVSHQLLLSKMKILGFNRKTLKIFESYLKDRRQYVSVDSFASEPLAVGPQSVTQGSTLSCALYLIFILDITQIYHGEKHDTVQYSTCSARSPVSLVQDGTNEQNQCRPINAKTYVDDNLILSKPVNNETLEQTVRETMRIVEDYTNANLLALNPEKTRVMVISKKKELRDNFEVQIGDKSIFHQRKAI